MSRLPVPGSDDGTWGSILNDFLNVEHNSDGTLKASGSLADKADNNDVVHLSGNETVGGIKTFSSSPLVPTPTTANQATNKSYVDSAVSAGAPDATTTSKGIVQLAGDLSGTATSPTVPGLASKVPTSRLINTSTGLTGGGDLSADRTLSVVNDTTTQKVEVARAGTLQATRKRLNFIAGANTTINVADDSAGNKADVTITATTQASTIVVNVKDQGAVGDGSTDDTAAINAAITAAQASGKNATVYFPAGTYKLTSVITLYQGMTWSGPIGAGEREFGARAVIVNSTTDMFQLTADTRDISISNLCFQGNSSSSATNWLTPVNLSSGFILKYSTIKDCGFDYFTNVLNARILGLLCSANYFNNCISTILTLAGSDNFICDNFFDSNLAGTPTAAFLVTFSSLSKTLFEGNYVTCCPSMGMKITGGSGNAIAYNKFDGLSPRGAGSDGAAIYIVSTNALVVAGNYFEDNVQNPFSNYTGVITLYDSSGVSFTDNIFENQLAGAKMYTIGQSSGTTDSIRIKGSVYHSATSKLATAGTVTNLVWDEWQGKYKTGSSARISDSDYPAAPPDGTTGIVYDTSNSTTYIAQRANGAWSHFAVTGSASSGLIATGINSTVNVTGTSETLIQSYTIAANSAVQGDTYRVQVGGTIDIGTAGGTLTIFVRIGGLAGTQIGGLAWTLLTSATTAKPFWTNFDVVIRGNAAASVTLASTAHGYGSSSVVNGSGVLNSSSGTKDLTVSQDLAVSAKFSASDAGHALHVETLTITKVR